MGKLRKRSKMPLAMSVFSATPVYMVMNTTACTRTPGRKNCRYSVVDPASAPPNRNVNISVIMTGKAVTSNSCIGTCLIFNTARQPKVSEADSPLGRDGRARGDRAERRPVGVGGLREAAGASVVMVVMRPPWTLPPFCVGRPGQRQEHLVQAGLAERKFGEDNARA